jgi:beta-glucosidase
MAIARAGITIFLPLIAAAQAGAPYRDPNLPSEIRAADLVSRLSLDEKVLQMQNAAPAISRLGVPAYDWWNEALHGVARAGLATVFPQAIGLAATWDIDLMFRAATVISTEARAKHHHALREGNHQRYFGLTFWSPNINIFRDPRWGRGQETYGEDPHLTAQMSVAFIRGMQGDDPRYYKTIATPKHYAVHSGPEPARHGFDARTTLRDLEETYLPAFRASVVEGGAQSVMCAYNRVNGVPACASSDLLETRLRGEWGFNGYVVSDCTAVTDIHAGHGFRTDEAEAAAAAVRAGTDLTCGDEYRSLVDAVRRGLITAAEIDRSLIRLFTARMRLGMFDPAETVPFGSIPYSVVDSPEHRRLALEAARKSIVLLKNEGILPLGRWVRRIAVIGPSAADEVALLGNYNGFSSQHVAPLEGIQRQFAGKVEVQHAEGSGYISGSPEMLQEAVRAVRESDVAVVFVGMNQDLEGEEMTVNVPGFEGGDRTSLDLPAAQEELIRAAVATGTPVVVVLTTGSAVAVNFAAQHAAAVLQLWYGGEEAGRAIAETLAGTNNPAGRLPVTFYRSASDLPPFDDYSMDGRTYRYFRGEPLYRFGHGLSYSRFAYSDLRITRTPAGVEVRVKVRNRSRREGDEVVQVYVTGRTDAIRELVAFRRIPLPGGATREVIFTLAGEFPKGASFDAGGGQPAVGAGF